VAGGVFALEVLTVGRVEYGALVPALAAAVVADWVCHSWGIHHVTYGLTSAGFATAGRTAFHIDPLLLVKVAIVGVAFGLAGLLFSEATHRVGALFKRLCPIS
jgi:H+/Cl- antiporter ClcA